MPCVCYLYNWYQVCHATNKPSSLSLPPSLSHARTHAHTHTHTHTHTNAHIHTLFFGSVGCVEDVVREAGIRLSLCLSVCLCLCVCLMLYGKQLSSAASLCCLAYIYVCVCVCVCVCLYVYACVYISVHTAAYRHYSRKCFSSGSRYAVVWLLVWHASMQVLACVVIDLAWFSWGLGYGLIESNHSCAAWTLHLVATSSWRPHTLPYQLVAQGLIPYRFN